MYNLSTAQQIYQTTIRDLPIIEQLKLVQLVLDALINKPNINTLHESSLWDEEDYADLTRASLTYAAQSMDEL